MSSTFTSNLRLEQVTAKEQIGMWGITQNRNLGVLIEQAVAGVHVMSVFAGTQALTKFNGAPDESRNAALVLSGMPLGPATVVVPPVNKIYDVVNQTAEEITLSTGGAGTYVMPPRSMAWVVVVDASSMFGVLITDVMGAALRRNNVSAALEVFGVAPLDSPHFSGEPTVPAIPAWEDSTLIATTEFVLAYGVPSGAITIWADGLGAVPAGWYVCDGSNGTPDLRDVIPLGKSVSTAVGDTGGSTDAVLVAHDHGGNTSGQSVGHTHTAQSDPAGEHVHGGVAVPTSALFHAPGSNPLNAGTVGVTDPDGAHSHTFVSGPNDVNHAHGIPTDGVDGAGKNMPPYVALYYIMKG